MSRARELAGFATATNPIQDLNVGVVTAISFSGDGSSLTGIDATSIKDGDGTVRAQANTSGVVVTGILTATSLEGDGSALTGLPAGLGTAVAASGDGANIYYTNQVLDVGSNLSVDVPATAVVAYTQYPEVAIASGIDLTIADGDDFVADILGIGTTGAPQLLAGGGGRVRADNFVAKDGYNAPTFANGINVSTAVTAATFHGDGSALTGMANTSDVSTSGLNVIGVGTFGSNISVADNIVHTGDTDTAIKFADNSITLDSAGSLALHIDGSAKIGFGTNSPQKPVDVYGESTGQLRVSNSSKAADLICDSTGGLLRTIGSYPLVFNTNQTDRLRIGTSGQIGLAVASGVSTDYGTSGQVLTSAGSGSAVQWADVSAGMWTTLASGTVTSAATGTITDDGISSTYSMYKLVFYAKMDGEVELGVDITTNGGTSWGSDTTLWTLSATGREQNSNLSYDTSSQQAGWVNLYPRNSYWGEITFGDTQNASRQPAFNAVIGFKRDSINYGGTLITNMTYATTAAFNGVRWFSSTGNMTSVKWVLQGTTFS